MSVIMVSSESEFDSHLSGSAGVLVDFYAEWCPPCKAIAPKLADLAAQFPDVKFLKVDVDANTAIAQRYSIRAMPTLIAFMRGEKVGEVIGANMPAVMTLVQQINTKFPGQGNKLSDDTEGAVPDDLAAAREARAKAAEARLAAMKQ